MVFVLFYCHVTYWLFTLQFTISVFVWFLLFNDGTKSQNPKTETNPAKNQQWQFNFIQNPKSKTFKAMDFKPRVSNLWTLSTTKFQVNPTYNSSTSSSTGSFAIRAPLTLDDDDGDDSSDFESNGHYLVINGSDDGGSGTGSDDGGSGTGSDFESNGHDLVIGSDDGGSGTGSDSVSESDGGFVSGEEFGTGPVLADPDKEIVRDSGDFDIGVVPRPFVVNPEENFSDISDEEEPESSDIEFDKEVRPPIAQLSMEDDVFHEMSTDDEMAVSASGMEYSGFSGVVKVPSVGNLDSALSDDNSDVDDKNKCAVGVREIHIEREDNNSDVKNVAKVTLEAGKAKSGGNAVFGECSGGEKPEMLESNLRPDKAECVGLFMKGSEDTMLLGEVQQRLENKAKHESDKLSREKSNFHVEFDIDTRVSGARDVKNVLESNRFDVRGNADFGQGSEETSIVDKAEYTDIVMEVSEETMHSAEVPQEEANHNSGKLLSLFSDKDAEGIIFESSPTKSKQFANELEQRFVSSSLSEGELELEQRFVSDEEIDESMDGEATKPYDYAALAALLKSAENKFGEFQDIYEESMSEEEKKKILDIQIKFLRLVNRLGHSHNEVMVASIFATIASTSSASSNQVFDLESAQMAAMQLEGNIGVENLNLSLNIFVLGKTGVGKTATINSIFGDCQERTNAFEPTTCSVKEIVGILDGVRVRIIDTPGLTQQATNRRTFTSIMKFMKKFPPDVILYVDRLDTYTKKHDDVPLLKSLINSLGLSEWKKVILVLTHATSPPPEGINGKPISYEHFVSQRSQIINQSINKAVGDLHLIHPVAIVENHPSCQRNEDSQSVLPNGESWRSQLLQLCYLSKLIQESNSILKPHEPSITRNLLGLTSGPKIEDEIKLRNCEALTTYTLAINSRVLILATLKNNMQIEKVTIKVSS